MITPEEYKKYLIEYKYFRTLPAMDTPPDTDPVYVHLKLLPGEITGFRADYGLYRLRTGRKKIDIETYYYTPAADGFLLWADTLDEETSGSWIDLYDHPDGFTDVFFRRYGDSDTIRLFIAYPPYDDIEDRTPNPMGLTGRDNRSLSISDELTVSGRQLKKEIFREFHFAYGEKLLRQGRRLLQEYYEDVLSYINSPIEEPLPEEDDSILSMWRSIAYWNWIRSYPGLFPVPQQLLSFSDFFTEEEIRTMQRFTKRDLYAVPDPAPLY